MLARAALLRYFLHYSVMSVMIKSYFTSKREKIKFEGRKGSKVSVTLLRMQQLVRLANNWQIICTGRERRARPVSRPGSWTRSDQGRIKR